MNASWIVERTASRRFPFRISLEQEGRLILAVRAQASWPGPGQQIFCLRERELDPAEFLERVELVPVTHLARVSRKLTVVLDRAQRKRCEFLTVHKPRRDGSGTYEHVFFRTESGIRAHRSRSRVELRAAPPTLAVVIDSAEQYPWRFPAAAVTRRKLPVGDYGLFAGERLAAALVIEADYRDFLDPARLKGRWPAAHLARVLGEVWALHPHLPIIYAGNRKLANAWTHQFFLSLAVRDVAPEPQLALQVTRRYDPAPRPAGLDEQVRQGALHELEHPFPFAALPARFPEALTARPAGCWISCERRVGSFGRVRGAARGGRGRGDSLVTRSSFRCWDPPLERRA